MTENGTNLDNYNYKNVFDLVSVSLLTLPAWKQLARICVNHSSGEREAGLAARILLKASKKRLLQSCCFFFFLYVFFADDNFVASWLHYLNCFFPVFSLTAWCLTVNGTINSSGSLPNLNMKPRGSSSHQLQCWKEEMGGSRGGRGVWGGEGGGAWGQTWRHGTNNLTLGLRSKVPIICHPEHLHLLRSKESSYWRVRNQDSLNERVQNHFHNSLTCTADTNTAPSPG